MISLKQRGANSLPRLETVVEELKKAAESTQPEIWELLQQEFALISNWLKTGELDRRQDWNLKKMESRLRRRFQRRRYAAPMTKRGDN